MICSLTLPVLSYKNTIICHYFSTCAPCLLRWKQCPKQFFKKSDPDLCYHITFSKIPKKKVSNIVRKRKQTPPHVNQEHQKNEEPDHAIVTAIFEDYSTCSKEESSSIHSYVSSEHNRKITRGANMLPSSEYPKLPELPKEFIPENDITILQTRTRYDNSSETGTQTGTSTRQNRFSGSTLDNEPYSYSQSSNEYQHSTPLNATIGPYYPCSSERTQQSSTNDYYSLSNVNSNQSSYSPGHYQQESHNLPYPCYQSFSSAAQTGNSDYDSLNLNNQSYSPDQQSNNLTSII